MPAAIYALAGGTFLMGTSEFVVAGLLTEVSTDFGVTVSQAGWAITVFAIGMILGAPATALLTLRVAQRTTLILALLIFTAGHILVAVTPDFPLMLAGRFMSATATGAFWAVGCVAAAQIAGPAFSSTALGLVLGGGMLATVLGVPVGSFSGQLLGWRGTFWALAALAIAAVAAIATRLPQGRPDRTCTSVRAEIRALRNPQLWLVLITCVLINAGVMSIYSYISVLLTDGAGPPSWTTPLVLMLFGVLAFVGNIVGGRLGDHRPLTTALTAAGLTLIAAVGIAWTYCRRRVNLRPL